MKLRLSVFLLVLALVPASYTLGQAIFTDFTGSEMSAGFPTLGTFNCPGGQPTGLFPFAPPCTEGSRVHVRGAKFPYIAQTNDPRVTGLEEVTMSGNFAGWRPLPYNDPQSGQMWGTLVFKVAELNGDTWVETGEVWEGTWTGTRTVTGEKVQSVIKAEAHGSGGRIEGLNAKWDVTLDPVANVGVIQGRILDPGGKSVK